MMGQEEDVGSVNSYRWIRCCQRLDCGQCEIIWMNTLLSEVRLWAVVIRVDEYDAVRQVS